MNLGQEQFQNFILERVRDEHKESAKEVLSKSFKKQDDGKFSLADTLKTQASLLKMLKPETIDEVKAAMAKFTTKSK